MTNLSHIFYSERSEYDGIVHKLIPDRTIDKKRLTIVFLHSREQDYLVPTADFSGTMNEKTIMESLEQLREVAELFEIHIVEIPHQQRDNLSKRIQLQGIQPQQVLFLPVVRFDHQLAQEIKALIYSGYTIIIGACTSDVSGEDWRSYHELGNGDEDHFYKGYSKGRIEKVLVQDFIDVLLWEEFRMEFRTARLHFHGLPFIRDIVVPCLRQLEIGEPQFRLHWREGVYGKYVREFAIELDWEPSEASRSKLVFREPIKTKPKSLRERFSRNSEEIYRFCQTERDYICLPITPEYDVGCCFTGISKDPHKSFYEIAKESEQLMQKSATKAQEFLARNAESVLQIGRISKWGLREIHPYQTLHHQEWDDLHIRDALRVSIEMIGDSTVMINPLASFSTHMLAERLYKQNN